MDDHTWRQRPDNEDDSADERGADALLNRVTPCCWIGLDAALSERSSYFALLQA